MKRVISLILALILTASPLFARPNTAYAAENTDIRAAVNEAFTEYLTTLNPGESAYDGTLQILSHALFGNGEDLVLDSDDYFTGLAMNSNLFKTSFVEGITAAFEHLMGSYEDTLYVGSIERWYTHGMDYSYFISNEQFDTNIKSLAKADYTGPLNSYDEAMILVSGTARTWVTIKKVEASADSFRYRVSFELRDDFEFENGNYKSEDATLAKALNWAGKMLEYGMVFHSFQWSARGEFEITISNDCPHQTGDFRWEYNGTDIAAVSGNGLTVNSATRIDETNSETGEPLAPYYELEETVRLHHNLPWVVEFRMKGTKGFMMAPAATYGSGRPYLLKTHDHVLGGEGFKYTEIDDETGEEKTLTGRNQYGVEFTKYGYSKTPWHTFRLENRVDSSGSNMVYLSVDGVELAPMTDYFVNKQSVNYPQNQTVDWFNGQDISINYLFNRNFRFGTGISMEYIQIWENGESNAPHSYYYTEKAAPTCTGKGYTSHICSQCGDIWKDNFVDALGHAFGAYVKKNDDLHSRICTVCGAEETDIHSWNADGSSCTLCGFTTDKSVDGSWTTDLSFSAADLGVSAPDSVIRATLTFAEDGKAAATWEAVDLTAMRLYFHQMFVSSYYAMAYGAGITDINQIEQFCMDSTGMSVSAYMDTIVTPEAIENAFTPAPTAGTYTYNADQTAIFTDLPIMDVQSDPAVPNSFVVGGDTLYLNAASYGKPDYTFVCTRK